MSSPGSSPQSLTQLLPEPGPREAAAEPPYVEVVIEIPRGSFIKRGSRGQVDFLSPFPCPFNYGSVHQYIGGEGDFLDAVVLGPQLPVGARVCVPVWGAVGLAEGHQYDDKLICAKHPVNTQQQRSILRFFHFYARCKSVLNAFRRPGGRLRCEGWGEAYAAIARARPAGGRPRQAGPGVAALSGVEARPLKQS